MAMPIISVIIPCYNSARFLGETIPKACSPRVIPTLKSSRSMMALRMAVPKSRLSASAVVRLPCGMFRQPGPPHSEHIGSPAL
jgi:hypothetical protein